MGILNTAAWRTKTFRPDIANQGRIGPVLASKSPTRRYYYFSVRPSFLGVNGEGQMKQVRGRQSRTAAGQKSAGFTVMELLIGIVIAVIMTVIAVPMLQSSISYFRLRGAVSSITGAIQSTRY